ncbi:MAG TPA: general secretion pathway protein GspB, partial [Rhodospirillales bacterium]|nr:general secretion pathway protein GspB [Rhodospirillales bacterium]
AMPPPPSSSELVDATALRDLPPSVQRTLPGIAITLHRYAASPEARMIRVNGRVAQEGDPVGGDLTVAEITRNGVVFVIGGQRFYMDAFQTWQAKSGS